MAPELKELYLTWDEIEDYQKGLLAGRFIGKNGIGFLVGAGVMKSSKALKNVYLSNKAKMFSGLKKGSPAFPALPPLPVFSTSTLPKNSWALACERGALMGKKYEMDHTLARLVPKQNVEIQNMLQKRAVDKAVESGLPVKTWEDVEKWTKTTKEGSKFRVDPREIPPMVVEAEIVNPGSAGVEIFLNEEGRVLSAAPTKEVIESSLKHTAEVEAYFANVKYNFDAHNKHIRGHNDFKDTGSIWQHKDPENLLKCFAGTGYPGGNKKPGTYGYKETVDFKEHIGIWKSPEGIELPTTRGTIHYSKKGAHIVPSNPNPTFYKGE